MDYKIHRAERKKKAEQKKYQIPLSLSSSCLLVIIVFLAYYYYDDGYYWFVQVKKGKNLQLPSMNYSRPHTLKEFFHAIDEAPLSCRLLLLGTPLRFLPQWHGGYSPPLPPPRNRRLDYPATSCIDVAALPTALAPGWKSLQPCTSPTSVFQCGYES